LGNATEPLTQDDASSSVPIADPSLNSCATATATTSAPIPPAEDIAFAARIAETELADAPPEDSFVRSDSSKTPQIPHAVQAYHTIPQDATDDDSRSIPKGELVHSDKAPSARQPHAEELIAAKPESPIDISPQIALGSDSPAMSSSASSRTASSSSAPENHPAPPPEVPPSEPRPAQPVRDVTLRLTADSQHVDVKLIDRGGELQVAVRSGDPVLNSDLRASVHDLIGGLEKSGFRAETWQPADAPRHPLETNSGMPPTAGHSAQSQSDRDPRRQGRNPYDADRDQARRGPATDRSNSSWMEQISAFISAQKDK
jgi:hypothetical protein